jgi:hypothetical protein
MYTLKKKELKEENSALFISLNDLSAMRGRSLCVPPLS